MRFREGIICTESQFFSDDDDDDEFHGIFIHKKLTLKGNPIDPGSSYQWGEITPINGLINK